MALVTLVYANIAISWQLLRFNSLKNIFLRFIGLKGLKMVWKKKFPDLKFFPLILAEKPVFPWFPWLEKIFKNFPWIPWSVGTLHILLNWKDIFLNEDSNFYTQITLLTRQGQISSVS